MLAVMAPRSVRGLAMAHSTSRVALPRPVAACVLLAVQVDRRDGPLAAVMADPGAVDNDQDRVRAADLAARSRSERAVAVETHQNNPHFFSDTRGIYRTAPLTTGSEHGAGAAMRRPLAVSVQGRTEGELTDEVGPPRTGAAQPSGQSTALTE